MYISHKSLEVLHFYIGVYSPAFGRRRYPLSSVNRIFHYGHQTRDQGDGVRRIFHFATVKHFNRYIHKWTELMNNESDDNKIQTDSVLAGNTKCVSIESENIIHLSLILSEI